LRTPTTALLWQIWQHNRQAALMLLGLTLVAWIADIAQYGFSPARSAGGPGPLNELTAMASFLLLLGVFSYTEPSGDRGIGRFPHRLFTLPVSTLRLVALPIVSGVIAIELLYLAWMGRFTTDGSTSRQYVALLLAAFMVFFQTVLWTTTRLGALRLVVLGAIAMALFWLGLSPSYAKADAPAWQSEQFLGGAVALAAIVAFLFAWNHVARLRAGGERAPSRVDAISAKIVDWLPSKRGAFASPTAAHFWYEWRSAGTALPVLVGGILFLFVAPASWLSRNDPGSGLGFFFGVLIVPILLAVPIGMAFAKPLFWSEELSLSPFVAVRPLSAAELVAIKLRVAALATVTTWALVLVFLVGWLASWGSATGLSQFAIQLWSVLDHSVLAVYGVAALVAAAGMVLTWRFLVVGVWAGHSGNRRLYVWSVLAVLLAVIAYMLFALDRLPGWVLEDPARMLPFVWGAAIAVIAKYWLAARVWRHVERPLALRYLAVWLVGTTTFVALVMVFWRIARIYIALDIYRFQSLLILLALLVVPLVRTGLAPALLERNRHRV
jgi:hypothetical protein